MALITFSIVFLILGLGWYSYRKVSKPKWVTPTEKFPLEWREILKEEVSFYDMLSSSEKQRFELKVQEFLLNCKVMGIKNEISLKDKLLVASSAIIPIFGFQSWRYNNIREVLIYPDRFNHNYDFEVGDERNILGMVGNRNMEGIMILSKEALEMGFKNETDKKNTAIHEFVHLLDKADGDVDGIPVFLMERQYAIPWIDQITKEMDKIHDGKSDINPYGGTNRAEFFSVVSEYFFERPLLLEKKHPELYKMLEKIFNQKMARRKLLWQKKTKS